MKIRFILTVLCLLMLNGCAGQDPNEKYMVSALGFSSASNDVKITLQVSSAESQDEKTLLHGSGKTISDAFDNAKASFSKTPSFGHCEAVVLSDDLDAQKVNDVIDLLDALGISLQSRIVSCDSASNLLDGDLSGDGIVALIKQSDENFGFGGNTAFFEIKTALIAGGGDFALPYISLSQGQPAVDGLLRYSSLEPAEHLDREMSRRYAKNKGLSKGELV